MPLLPISYFILNPNSKLILTRYLSWRLIKLLIQLQFPEIKQLSTADLADWLSDDSVSKPIILDARMLKEYEVSHIKNAQLAPSNLEDLVKEINFSTPIVTYCSVGYRSTAIARRLQSQGYQNVFNLSGSIFQWVNENRPVYHAGKPITKIHYSQ